MFLLPYFGATFHSNTALMTIVRMAYVKKAVFFRCLFVCLSLVRSQAKEEVQTWLDHQLDNLINRSDLPLPGGVEDDYGRANNTERAADLAIIVKPLLEENPGQNRTDDHAQPPNWGHQNRRGKGVRCEIGHLAHGHYNRDRHTKTHTPRHCQDYPEKKLTGPPEKVSDSLVKVPNHHVGLLRQERFDTPLPRTHKRRQLETNRETMKDSQYDIIKPFN